MKKTIAALAAAILMLATLGVAAALADEGGADKCEKSNDKAEGCELHPGEHDDDDDGGTGTPSCADIPATDTPLDEVVATVCAAVEGLLGGEAPGPGGEPPVPLPEPGGEPSCDDLGALAQEAADACNTIVETLTGGGGEPDPGPGGEPPIPVPDPGGEPGIPADCSAFGELDDALATGGAIEAGCNELVGALPL